jgi:outer membrane protein
VARLATTPVERVLKIRDDMPPSAVPDDPRSALALARERNAGLARLRNGLDAARSNVRTQEAGAQPTLDMVANLTRSRSTFFDGGSPSQTPTANVGLVLAVPVFTGGVIEARVREAQALTERAEADLRDGEASLESDITKAYIDLSRSRQQLTANLAALAIANASLEATMKAFNAGVRGNIDVLNAQQQTFAGRREALRARAGILIAQVRILALAGLLDGESLRRLELAFAD